MEHSRKRRRLMTPQDSDRDEVDDGLVSSEDDGLGWSASDIPHQAREHVKRHAHHAHHHSLPNFQLDRKQDPDSAEAGLVDSQLSSDDVAEQSAPATPTSIADPLSERAPASDPGGPAAAPPPPAVAAAGPPNAAVVPASAAPAAAVVGPPDNAVVPLSLTPGAVPGYVSTPTGLPAAASTVAPAVTAAAASVASDISSAITSHLPDASGVASAASAGPANSSSTSATMSGSTTHSSAMMLPMTNTSMSTSSPSSSATSLASSSQTTFLTMSSSATTDSTISTSSIPSTSTSSSPSSSAFSSSVESSSVVGSSGSSTAAGGAGAGSSQTSSSASSAQTNAITQNQSNNGNGVATPQVVGGVVGGIAGLTILLVLALLLMKWYKKRRNAGMTPLGTGGSDGGSLPPTSPEMSEAHAANASAAVPAAEVAGTGAVAGGFMRRHSRAKQTQPPTEQGFQRISGRKLPSQFSPGIEGPSAVGAASGAAYPSGSSHYPSGGTFLSTGSSADPFIDPSSPTDPYLGGAGAAAAASAARRQPASPKDQERFMSGPARTPKIYGGDTARTSHMPQIFSGSPPDRGSTNSPASRPALSRNTPSYASSRTSRFQEEV